MIVKLLTVHKYCHPICNHNEISMCGLRIPVCFSGTLHDPCPVGDGEVLSALPWPPQALRANCTNPGLVMTGWLSVSPSGKSLLHTVINHCIWWVIRSLSLCPWETSEILYTTFLSSRVVHASCYTCGAVNLDLNCSDLRSLTDSLLVSVYLISLSICLS